ncbi:unnamed protein product [Acanthosepion pharaonis]|uniref:Uncharacterized protein n=1 Tax=Acanthosepion pharaonis TaxID=158019 RepID=A0A812D1S2_ACAPH|nr:unnamed protein product [Sepia pharaonis]
MFRRVSLYSPSIIQTHLFLLYFSRLLHLFTLFPTLSFSLILMPLPNIHNTFSLLITHFHSHFLNLPSQYVYIYPFSISFCRSLFFLAPLPFALFLTLYFSLTFPLPCFLLLDQYHLLPLFPRHSLSLSLSLSLILTSLLNIHMLILSFDHYSLFFKYLLFFCLSLSNTHIYTLSIHSLIHYPLILLFPLLIYPSHTYYLSLISLILTLSFSLPRFVSRLLPVLIYHFLLLPVYNLRAGHPTGDTQIVIYPNANKQSLFFFTLDLIFF